jgi:multidrug efflux pump subunit AcrB
MGKFAILNPHFILVLCLVTAVIGVTALTRMPVDMFPVMNIPVVVVATFYNGMAPQQIEADITSRFERFFTLGSGIEHIESRSLPGVSVIKVYFQPGTNADSAVTTIANLAMAQLRRLPPGTLPPVVLRFDASSLPVCLVTFKGSGLDETKLRTLHSSQCETNWRKSRGRRYQCHLAAHTARSWCTSIRTSWKLIISAPWTLCER